MEPSKKSNRTTLILAVLLVLAVIAGGYFWNKSRSLNTANKELSGEVTTLRELRTDLLNDIEILQTEYDNMITSNDSLESMFESATAEVVSQKAEIKKIKTDFAKDATGMKAEIEQLRTIKKDLSDLVAQLRSENELLKQSNRALNEQVTSTEARNLELTLEVAALRQLTAGLERDNKSLMAASTRATNLRVDIRKKGDQPTGSARRAREVTVSFEIQHLPADKRGEHPLYIVIKGANGVPVKVANPVMTTITSNASGQSEAIVAQQMLTASLFEQNRLQFKVNPEPGTLQKGYYRAVIYADWGMLGGVEFQLR